jgi:hypothetical protein
MKLRTLSTAGLVFASIAAAAPLAAQAQVAAPSQATLWLGTERIALGLGQRRGPSLALPQAQPEHAERTLGIGVGLTPSTMVTFESDARAWRSHDAWVSGDPHRVGLSFRTTHQSREVKSLLTVQLSGQSVLQLRPRGSGLRAVYTATF